MTYYAVITEPHKELAVRHILKKAGEAAPNSLGMHFKRCGEPGVGDHVVDRPET